MVEEAFDAWRPLVGGKPHIAREKFFWERGPEAARLLLASKGFENKPATATCGTNWTTDPGDSPPPPAPLPAYMAVLVSSKITKSGPKIGGNTVRVVIVKVDPGYQPNPGHAATGTVVAVVC